MPRRPNPETKDQQAYVRAKTEEERKKIKGAKEICARNDIEIRDVLMAGIDRFLIEHNWPPGNSQVLLQTYGVHPTFECSRCHKKFPKLQRVKFISGETGQLCQSCLDHEAARTVIKKRMELIQ